MNTSTATPRRHSSPPQRPIAQHGESGARSCRTSRSQEGEATRQLQRYLLVSIFILVGLVAIKSSSEVTIGPLSAHMVDHIAMMNLIAPAIAAALLMTVRVRPASALAVVCATVAQIVALWFWHVPVVFEAAMSTAALHLTMWASLLTVALVFWTLILNEKNAVRWRAIVALLVTGKLFCLLGSLLIFAPRPLYSCVISTCTSRSDSLLADQQLAGLLMVAACPLTFVSIGIVLAARWLAELSCIPPGINTLMAAAPSKRSD